MKIILSKNRINVLSISFASLCSKATLFLLYLYVARSVEVAEYGLLTSSTEFIGVFLVVCSFGFQMASVREYKKATIKGEEGSVIFDKILLLRLIMGAAVFLIAIGVCVLLYAGTANYSLIMMLAPMVLLEPWENHYYTFFWSRSELHIPALAEVIKVIIYASIFFLLSWIDEVSVVNVVISSLLGYTASLVFKGLWAKYKWGYRIRIERDWGFIRRFFSASFYFGIVSVLYILSLRVDIQMLNQISSQEQVGLYSAAWQLVQIGIIFIQAISTSIFPTSMARMHEKSYRAGLQKRLFQITLLLLLGCLVATFSAPLAIDTLYGSEYASAALVFSIIVWYLPMRLFSIFASQMLESGVWYKRRVFIYAVPLGGNVLCNLWLIPHYGAVGAAVSALISNMVLLLSLHYFAKRYEEVFFDA